MSCIEGDEPYDALSWHPDFAYHRLHARQFQTFFAATEAANLAEDDIPGRSRIALQFGIEITGPGLSDKNVQDILQGRHPPAEEIGL